MPNWEQMVMSAVRTIRPDIAEKAEKELNNYSHDRAGLQQLIKDKGGMAFVDQATNFATKAPRVRAWFDKFGINPNALKENVVRELQNSEPKPMTTKSNLTNPASSSLERLKKLR